MSKAFSLLASVAIFSSHSLHSKDFGVAGHSFPIKENSLVEVLKDRIQHLSKKDLVLTQNKIKDDYENKLRNPKPIELPKAKAYSVYYFDPTITLQKDITDHKGKVIAKKGSKYNPLKISPLNNTILLFDGDDRDQCAWARSNDGIWVLVRGKPLDLEEEEGRPVYFDQGGFLCKKFGVNAIPARISQKETVLKVELIPEGES